MQLEPNNAPHVAIVISPLRALMVDQLQRCADMHIRALMVNRATEISTEEKTGLFNRTRYSTRPDYRITFSVTFYGN